MIMTKTEQIITECFCTYTNKEFAYAMKRFDGTPSDEKGNHEEFCNDLSCILYNYVRENNLEDYMSYDMQVDFAEAEAVYRTDYSTNTFKADCYLDDVRLHLIRNNFESL